MFFTNVIFYVELQMVCFRRKYYSISNRFRLIISDYYHSGVIEVGVFATEDVAQRIADEVGIANH